jgi:hypothetical protein
VQGEVVEGAVDWVLLLCLCVFVSSDYLELRALELISSKDELGDGVNIPVH